MSNITAVLMYKPKNIGGISPQTVGFEGGGVVTIIYTCPEDQAVDLAKVTLNSTKIDWHHFKTKEVNLIKIEDGS